jgi:hypothetical protein
MIPLFPMKDNSLQYIKSPKRWFRKKLSRHRRD